MHGNTNPSDSSGARDPAGANRRKPLAPLPPDLAGPVRDFVTGLRHMHGELGLSLKELEERLPASRSSLSRYLNGRSLPDERLLVQWCKLSFTGEDRLPRLVGLLHAANEAAAAGELDDTTEATEEPAVTAAAPARHTPAPRLKFALAAAGTVAAIATAAVLTLLLTDSGGGDPGASGTPAADEPAPSGEVQNITVHNVEKNCRDNRRRECALGMALDPYVPYRPSNIGGRAWHGDILKADCRIANGVTVTDESGGHSSIWYRVEQKGKRLWMPGIRISPGQLQYSDLRNCP
ncbi:helix-turn-helix transcriptional regulator [Streptomyces monticola]|uniref:Helix-turn-helix transcriptional regulator n=1 Tax=Streptomyces monticola TaxID=2666263 RepID=A0ABW2JDE8_9ACTN